MILDHEKQRAICASKMKRYDAMPEDVQALSRQFGSIVDAFYANGYSAEEIKAEIRVRGARHVE